MSRRPKVLSNDPALDDLLAAALTNSTAFADELTHQLVKHLADARQAGAPTFQLVGIARNILQRYSRPLADILTDVRLAAWLGGGNSVLDAIAASGGAGSLPPRLPPAFFGEPEFGPRLPRWTPLVDEATKHLQERRLLTRPEFDAAKQTIRQRAFTVANLETTDALAHVQQGLIEAVSSGTTLKAFRKLMGENVETSPLGAGHLENVFRTGTGSAYAAGLDRIATAPGIRHRFPYRAREPITDSRITEYCERLAGAGIGGTNVFRADDPFWLRTRPISHYQCRCSTLVLTIEQAADRGIASARRWLETGKEPADFVKPVDLSKLEGYPGVGWVAGGGLAA